MSWISSSVMEDVATICYLQPLAVYGNQADCIDGRVVAGTLLPVKSGLLKVEWQYGQVPCLD